MIDRNWYMYSTMDSTRDPHKQNRTEQWRERGFRRSREGGEGDPERERGVIDRV